MCVICTCCHVCVFFYSSIKHDNEQEHRNLRERISNMILPIHISHVSVQAGVITTFIVYNTAIATGTAASIAADTGLKLAGLAASMGISYVAGAAAGASIVTATGVVSHITKSKIESGTEMAAMAASAVAGAGTVLAFTAAEYTAYGIAKSLHSLATHLKNTNNNTNLSWLINRNQTEQPFLTIENKMDEEPELVCIQKEQKEQKEIDKID